MNSVPPAGRTSLPTLGGARLPWIGHALAFGRDPVAFLRGARERAGNAFQFTLLGQPVAFLCGRSAHEAVFRADEAVLSPKEAYRFMAPVFGPGIAYDAEPAEMERQIGYLLPALTSRRLAAHTRTMQTQIESYLAVWGDHGEVDLAEAMNELTVAVATRCLLGDEVADRMGHGLTALYQDLECGIRLAGLLSPKVPLPSFRRRDRARAALGNVLGNVIAERRARQGTYEPQDMLTTLLHARDPQGRPLDDQTIIGLLITMVFAGQHTSAVLAAWTGVLLLQHPDHLPALLREQHETAAGTGTITAPMLHRMERLEHCVREAERMYPPLVVLLRKALLDFHHEGFRIPAGSLVMVSPAVSHRLPDVFAEPDVYDPARYGPGRAEHAAAYTLVGFGGGKHRCVGMAFAYQQVKLIWSILLRRYELRLGAGSHAPDYSTFVPGPRRPCTIHYTRRGELEYDSPVQETQR
ncbi:cytochrome P450 [Streptomyces mirabilis]|nr:cytochrome P450 [Streptomyces mirabilis]